MTDITARLVPVFPANVNGGGGIDITISGGTYTISLDLDDFSSQQGSLLMRNGTVWVGLPPGPVSYVLTSNGSGADLTWEPLGTASIPDGSITEPKYATDSVSTRAIAPAAVTSTQLANSAVTTTTVNDKAITLPKMADGTTGGLITYDLSGVASVITGTSGQVPTVQGDGSLIFETPSASGGGRELLTANRTYYVRTDGSDANDGLTDNAGGAFLTIQKAIDTAGGLDLGIYVVTISIGIGGTYAGFDVTAPFVGGPGSGVVVDGNVADAGSRIISSQVTVSNFATVSIQGVDFTSSAYGLSAQSGGVIKVSGVSIFGVCTSGHMIAERKGQIIVETNYSIDGGSQWHMITGRQGFIGCQNRTVTLTGTPAFSIHFVNGSSQGQIDANDNTYTGTATGVRYRAQTGALIFTGTGGSATYFPGDTAGTVDATTYGIYS